MTLYDVDERLVTLLNDHFDTEDGTIYESEEELAQKIDEVSMELDTKIENIGCYIKNLEADVEALKKEESNLKARRLSAERKIEGLKRYLDGYLTACYPNEDDKAKWKFKTPKVVLGFRKSTTVEVPDLDKLDKRFIREKIERMADKMAIKDILKKGDKVDGAFLKQNINLSVK
jgi:predicted RNase H-like nuclease (RuvC/YqgF family)